MTVDGEIGIIVSPLRGRGAAHSAGGFGYNLREGVRHVRLTIHIGKFTVTIIVKKRGNRHSGK